jgi:hypothetical protein
LARNAVEVETLGFVDAVGDADGLGGTPPPNLHQVIGSAAFGYGHGRSVIGEAAWLGASSAGDPTGAVGSAERDRA